MNDEKMDLSILDPSRDEARWNRLVESVASKAWNARRRDPSVSFQVVSWARPVLAIAASLALVSWAAPWAHDRRAPSTAYLDGSTTSIPEDRDPTTQLAQWAAADRLPTTLQILEILGARNGTD